MTDHKAIPDAELHEPKGVAGAAAGTTYHADGAGSGSWSLPSASSQSASITLGKTANNTSATTITVLDTYYPAAGTFNEEDAEGMTTTVATGRLNVATAGDYDADASISIISSRSTAVVCFSFLVDGVATGGRIRRKIGTGSDVGAIAIHAHLHGLAAANYIQLGITFLTGEGGVAGDTVTVENCIFNAHLTKAS